jgi:hypothetical protein
MDIDEDHSFYMVIEQCFHDRIEDGCFERPVAAQMNDNHV